MLASLPEATPASLRSARGVDSASGSIWARLSSRFSSRFWWPLALGATAVLAFLVLRGPREDTPIFRGDREVATPLAPRGDLVTLPERFIWTKVDGAVSYRVRVYDSEARVVGDTATADTFLVAGGWIDFDVLRSATWTVTPEAPGRTFRISASTSFHLPR